MQKSRIEMSALLYKLAPERVALASQSLAWIRQGKKKGAQKVGVSYCSVGKNQEGSKK